MTVGFWFSYNNLERIPALQIHPPSDQIISHELDGRLTCALE